jgi:hypothetical protein
MYTIKVNNGSDRVTTTKTLSKSFFSQKVSSGADSTKHDFLQICEKLLLPNVMNICKPNLAYFTSIIQTIGSN